MIRGSFFFFITVAILSYGVQGSLQSYFARRYDPFAVAVYRNVALAFTMLPIFFFIPISSLLELREHVWTYVAACATGLVAMVLALTATRYLPIGISSAIRQIVQVSVSILIGVIILHEFLTVAQLSILIGLVLITVSLVLLRSGHTHLDPQFVWRGVVLTICAGVMASLTIFFFSRLSRVLHPLAASYAWESGIGICALLYVIWLAVLRKKYASFALPARDSLKIMGISLLTIPATTSFAFAFSSGPFPLAAGLITMTALVATGVGWFLYEEKLTKIQVSLIVIAVGLMFLLKVSS